MRGRRKTNLVEVPLILDIVIDNQYLYLYEGLIQKEMCKFLRILTLCHGIIWG